jgi:hypothetical protein
MYWSWINLRNKPLCSRSLTNKLTSNDDALYATVFNAHDYSTRIVVLDEHTFQVKKKIAVLTDAPYLQASRLDIITKTPYLFTTDYRLISVDLKSGQVLTTVTVDCAILCLQ